MKNHTLKHLEEDIQGKLLYISSGNDFLDMTPKTKPKNNNNKAKNNKWYCIKLTASAQ